MSQKITMIKQDAVVNVQIGAGMLEKLQQAIFSLLGDRSEEEIAHFQDRLSKGELDFEEGWMQAVFILSALISGIEKEAVQQGHTYEQELTTPQGS